MFRKNYTNEQIIDFAKSVTSIAQLLEKLGLKKAGGNYANIKRKLQELAVDTSHWTGKSWNKDQQLKDWSKYSRAVNLKKHLIKTKGHQCESCGLQEWMNQLIVLEIHHIDGDKTNNSYSNLQLLCPNCHSITDSWRKQKSSRGGI